MPSSPPLVGAAEEVEGAVGAAEEERPPLRSRRRKRRKRFVHSLGVVSVESAAVLTALPFRRARFTLAQEADMGAAVDMFGGGG
jgi:hypothetical protein